jgi:hypothetical protein
MSCRALLTALPILGVAFVALTSRAFDHADGPQAAIDPATDIADVYAFMRPEQGDAGAYAASSHIVLVATFEPNAAPGSAFPNATYQFRVRNVKDASNLTAGGLDTYADFKVVCTFLDGKPQEVTCSMNGKTATAQVENEDAGPPSADIRIFAGVRADPAFADFNAFVETLDAGQLRFSPTGNNAFAGKTVRALVVEFNVNRVGLAKDAAPDAPATAGLWAIGVESQRIH